MYGILYSGRGDRGLICDHAIRLKMRPSFTFPIQSLSFRSDALAVHISQEITKKHPARWVAFAGDCVIIEDHIDFVYGIVEEKRQNKGGPK